MNRLSPAPGVVFRAIVLVGLRALIPAMIGAGLGRLLLGLDMGGEAVATGLAVCGGIWALVLLAGVVLTLPWSGLGEYFWQVAPVVAALSLSLALAARSDADWAIVVGYGTLGSLGSYGAAVAIHLLIRRARPRRRV